MQVMLHLNQVSFQPQLSLNQINHVLIIDQSVISLHDESFAFIYVYEMRKVLHVKFTTNEELISTVNVRQCSNITSIKVVI